MRISEAAINDTITIDLIVKSSTIKYTKPPGNKPYLFMELFDGETDIVANDWNYGDKPSPPKNTVLTVTAIVTEFPVGTKQLNIKSAKRNEALTANDFMPKGPVDVEEYFALANELISNMQSAEAINLSKRLLTDFNHLWKCIPGAKSIHHAFLGGALKHSVDVAIKALALSKTTTHSNDDLCVLGGLFHDLGKLWTYSVDGVAIDFTELGVLLDHQMIGITKLENYRTEYNSCMIDLLVHIIASHHGLREWGSPVTPRFIEAWFVHLADMADAKAETIIALAGKTMSNLTDKDWSLDNRPSLTPTYITNVMLGLEEKV